MEGNARFASRIERVTTATLLACVVTITVLGAPRAVFGQEDEKDIDCESVCRVFPDRAPPKCGCEADITGSSSDGGDTWADPAAQEIIERMEQRWLEQTAGIENYTVVLKSSIGGLPAVEYYEKEMVDGLPAFRRVSTAELSLREAEATGTDVNLDAAAAMSQMIEGLAGPPDEEQAAPEADASAIGIPLSTEQKNALKGLLEGAGDFLKAGIEFRDSIHAMDATAEIEGTLWGGQLPPQWDKYKDWLFRYGVGCIYGTPTAAGEVELVAHQAGDAADWSRGVECPEKSEFDLLWGNCQILGYSSSDGPRLSEYRLSNYREPAEDPPSEAWTTETGDKVDDVRVYFCPEEYGGEFGGGDLLPVYFSANVSKPGDPRKMKVTSWHYDYDFIDARFIPRQRGTRLGGLTDGADFLVSGLGSAVTIFYRVLEVLANNGPPTQKQIAEILGGHMEETATQGSE